MAVCRASGTKHQWPGAQPDMEVGAMSVLWNHIRPVEVVSLDSTGQSPGQARWRPCSAAFGTRLVGLRMYSCIHTVGVYIHAHT